MDRFRKLAARRTEILEQITALGPMRRGSIEEQFLPYKRSDGSIRRRGPYLTYTFKREGKTCGRHLRNAEEAEPYRRQIETYRRYQELSAELVEVSQALADLEAAGDAGGKKNSRS
jgi:hypothetical protein